MSSKEIWYCRECGSTNITHDALAMWDEEAEDFIVVEVLPGDYCGDCERIGTGTFGVILKEANDAAE